MTFNKFDTKLTNILKSLLVILLFSIACGVQAQEVRDAALSKGVKFGSPLFELFDENNRQLFRDNVSVGTVPAYWKYSTRITEEYTFDITDEAVQFAEENDWDVHGHPLVWGSDLHLPDWLLNKPASEAEEIMLDHIRTVAGRYRGRIDVWDVVNEAIEDDGSYRDSYWHRAMNREFIAKAFIEAKNTDGDALLLYNDYGIETNAAKFNTVKSMLSWIASRGAQVDGLGWQLHTDVTSVLDPNFPLAQRMQEISDMGLGNYVTELDIRIPENTDFWLERQQQAYKKVTTIFLRNSTRGKYFQTWGLTDVHTWFDDFQPENAPHQPLPFGRSYEKKPAYWGLFEAFSDDTNVIDTLIGELRIRNLWSNTYLHQNDNNPGADTSLQNPMPESLSQRWNIEAGDTGYYRLHSSGANNYLHNIADYDNAPVQVHTLNPNWWSQQWSIENAYDNVYRLKNRWTGRYLHTSDQFNVITYPLNQDWRSQLWVFEYIR